MIFFVEALTSNRLMRDEVRLHSERASSLRG